MSDWQQGYADAYVNPAMRGYPRLAENADYMAGFTAGQEEWRAR